MPSAEYTETYKKINAMGEKIKAAGTKGPDNDEKLSVCISLSFALVLCLLFCT
jgi:hypothetical protein